jgi:hypothetical protein
MSLDIAISHGYYHEVMERTERELCRPLDDSVKGRSMVIADHQQTGHCYNTWKSSMGDLIAIDILRQRCDRVPIRRVNLRRLSVT